MEPRNSRSLAISEMLKNISFRLPATVISSTGICQFAAGYPKARCATRIVAGHQVCAVAEKLGDVEAFRNFGNNLLAGLACRLQKIIAGTDAGRTRKAAGCVGCGLKAELLGGVSIQQVRLQHAVFDDHGTASGDAFPIERAGTKTTDHGAVVDDGDVISGNFLPKLSRQK